MITVISFLVFIYIKRSENIFLMKILFTISSPPRFPKSIYQWLLCFYLFCADNWLPPLINFMVGINLYRIVSKRFEVVGIIQQEEEISIFLTLKISASIPLVGEVRGRVGSPDTEDIWLTLHKAVERSAVETIQ